MAELGGGTSGRWMAGLAVVLSVAALGISLVEVSAVREQQRTSVWPYLALADRYSSDGFDIRLVNKGFGPAITGHVELRYQGEAIVDAEDLVEKMFAAHADDDDNDGYYTATNLFDYEFYRTSEPSFSVLAAGEGVTLFGVPWQTDRISTRRFVDDLRDDGVEAIACYCSLDEQCWTVTLSERLARKTSQCDGLDF
ncbi:MAG: hypothetical protein AAFX44_11745 [Pseudomonadota bacterium]